MPQPKIFVFLHILSAVSAFTTFRETLNPISVVPTLEFNPFNVSLINQSAFQLEFTSLQAPHGVVDPCRLVPSRINPVTTWTGQIHLLGDHSFDNIVEINNYYFALDTNSLMIVATHDLKNSSSYIFIESTHSNQAMDQGRKEVPHFVLDNDNKVLYIITTQLGLSYELTKFFEALKNNHTIPKITEVDPNLRRHNNTRAIKYYSETIFIVADNVVDAYRVSYSGKVTYLPPRIDAEFFEADAISIMDIAFKDKYAYLLDELGGIRVLNITSPTIKYVPERYMDLRDGKYITAIGNSLIIVTSTSRHTSMWEYKIGTETLPLLNFNREIELPSSIRDFYSDSNYIYLITGMHIIATKHSISNAYTSRDITDAYISYWPISGITAVTAISNGLTSNLTIIQGTNVIAYKVDEASAALVCNAHVMKSGNYVFDIKGISRNCASKLSSSAADHDDVCEITQRVEMKINRDFIPIIEAKEPASRVLFGLLGAILVLGVLIGFYILIKRRSSTQNSTSSTSKLGMFKKLSRAPVTLTTEGTPINFTTQGKQMTEMDRSGDPERSAEPVDPNSISQNPSPMAGPAPNMADRFRTQYKVARKESGDTFVSEDAAPSPQDDQMRKLVEKVESPGLQLLRDTAMGKTTAGKSTSLYDMGEKKSSFAGKTKTVKDIAEGLQNQI